MGKDLKEKKPFFKKWWFWLIVVIVILGILGSSGSDDNAEETPVTTNTNVANTNDPNETSSTPDETPNETPDETPDEPEPTESTLTVGDSVELEDFKVTLLDAKSSQGTDFFKPEDGKVFVGLQLEVENISDESQSFSSVLHLDTYVDGVKQDFSVTASATFSDGVLDGEVSPGRKLIGWSAVEVPVDSQEIEIELKDNWLSSKNKVVFKTAIPK